MRMRLLTSVLLSGLAGFAVSADNVPVVLAGGGASATPATASAPKAWSPYQPVQAPHLPIVKNKRWAGSPIDAFVLAKLEAAGLAPSMSADRATYIRRATLDTWGLLPTPREVKDFVQDKSPQAYEKLVDRLLTSPHFGERQARRWLDLARYADSTGFQNDNTRPNNWRYRDYVVNAFNQDKPYNRFVQEQIAGDELWPDSQDARIATGFLAGYPDNANSRDLVQRKYQIETDVTDQVGATLLSATVGCARCHNHKSDKVSQKDYFQFLAFFANTSFDEKAPLAKGSENEFDRRFQAQQAAYREATKSIRDQQKAIVDKYRSEGEKYHKERYLTDSRDAIFKPEKDWTSLDRWVNWRLKMVSSDQDIVAYLRVVAADKSHPEYSQEKADALKEYERLSVELKKFNSQKPEGGSAWITTVTELGHADAPPTFIRFTGIHERPTVEVQPAIPALWLGNAQQPVITPTATSSGRRSALAAWLTSPDNPLVARAFVNRVWSQYFDAGIIGTVADFGRAGEKPTNPELLDYLASNFVANGWSVKKLERQILLSNTYRQASIPRADALKVDPSNKLLAYYPRKRLEAEEIRDALLEVSGLLNDQLGGPAVFPPIAKGVSVGEDFNYNALWVVSRDKQDWNRRSLYIFSRRSMPYPLLQNFDPANPSSPHHKRDVTTTPLQALTLYNSDLSFSWSQALAGRVINAVGDNEKAQINCLYQILYSRAPQANEETASRQFLTEDENIIRAKGADGRFEVATPVGLKNSAQLDPIRAAAFVDLVHTVINSNDFAYRF